MSNKQEARLALGLTAPTLLVIALIALFPLLWTVWESLHLHDLRMPWRGRPFVGLDNYAELLRTSRFWEALAHTAVFAIRKRHSGTGDRDDLRPGPEPGLPGTRPGSGAGAGALGHPHRGGGLVVALHVRRTGRYRERDPGGRGAAPHTARLVHPRHRGVDPLILADVWKTTPFVALLLLAGLQNIDAALYEAARMDGAGAWHRFRHITLPLLQPAMLVALIFRTLDAFRVFDLVYVMTGGGPGTTTEPIASTRSAPCCRTCGSGMGRRCR